MTDKKAGILLPIFSLPSKYGIGSLGKSAFEFVDFLQSTNQHYWQVLPMGPTIYGDSPYQSPSAFAGNHYFIDIDTLVEDGLLDIEFVKGYQRDSAKVDYGYCFNSRLVLLRKAFEIFDINSKDYVEFKEANAFWLTTTRSSCQVRSVRTTPHGAGGRGKSTGVAT